MAIDVIVGACEDMLDREFEKQAFPAEVDSLYDGDVSMRQLGLDGWAGCESADYREDQGKQWLVLKHST